MRFERCGSKDLAWKTHIVSDLGTLDAFMEATDGLVQGFNQRGRESGGPKGKVRPPIKKNAPPERTNGAFVKIKVVYGTSCIRK